MYLPRWAIQFAEERLSRRHFQVATVGVLDVRTRGRGDAGYFDAVVGPDELDASAEAVAEAWAKLPAAAYAAQVRVIRGARIAALEAAVAATAPPAEPRHRLIPGLVARPPFRRSRRAVRAFRGLENLAVCLDGELVFWYGFGTSSCAPSTGAAPPSRWSMARREVPAWLQLLDRCRCVMRWIRRSRPTRACSAMSRLPGAGPARARRSTGSKPNARPRVGGHQRGIGTVDGAASTQAWLRHRTGMREGDARTSIEAAACQRPPPEGGGGVACGEITGGAAKTIAAARVEGHDAKLVALEDLLLSSHKRTISASCARACTHFRNCARADGTEPRQHDGLTICTGYDGRKQYLAELSSSAAETFENTLHALTDPPSDGDTRTPARRRADALVRMAELAMANLRAVDDGDTVLAKAACTIVVDWTTLTGETFDRLDGAVHRHPSPHRRRTPPVRLLGESGRHRPRRVTARRRPIPPDDPTPTRPRPPSPRRRLSISGLHPTARLDPSPSRHPLERRRRNHPRQHRLALRPPPSRRPLTRLDREVRRPHLHRHPPRRHPGDVVRAIVRAVAGDATLPGSFLRVSGRDSVLIRKARHLCRWVRWSCSRGARGHNHASTPRRPRTTRSRRRSARRTWRSCSARGACRRRRVASTTAT